jgi:hypothetical protein
VRDTNPDLPHSSRAKTLEAEQERREVPLVLLSIVLPA